MAFNHADFDDPTSAPAPPQRPGFNPDDFDDPPARAKSDGFDQWYAKVAAKRGLDPNPDAPEHYYDYRSFYSDVQAGKVKDPEDGGHFTSAYKLPGHPREFLNDSRGRRFDTKAGTYVGTGEPVSARELDNAEFSPEVMPRGGSSLAPPSRSARDIALASEPDEAPPMRASPGAPRSPDGVPALRDPTAHTAGETAVEHAASGLTGGFYDEAVGVGGTPEQWGGGMGMFPGAFGAPMDPKTVAALEGKGPPAVEEYRRLRDETRQRLEDERAENPKTALAADLAGSIASPINKLGPGAVKGAGALANIGRGAVRAGVQGAVFGAGNSNADLTTLDPAEVKNFVRDVGVGTAVSAGVGAAGEVAAAGVRAAGNAVKDRLGRMILNEVAEGTANTTPTGRRRLEKAGEDIVKEVVEGPDGKQVRAAYSASSAAKGRAELRPIIEKVAQRNDAAYSAFEKAGREAVDPDTYGLLLLDSAQKLDKAGQPRVADAVRAVQQKAEQLAERTGGLTLQQLRGFTSEIQGQMTSVLGSLNEHANAKTALQVQQVATKAMDDMLSLAAAGDKSLTEAANTIRANNERFHALLTIDDSLRLRSYKESTGQGPLVRAAKALTGGAAAGYLGAAASDDEDKLRNGLLAAAGGAGLVAGARALERGITTAAIKGSQGGLPKLASAEAAAGTLARTGARAAASPQRPNDDAVVQLFRMAKMGGNEDAVMKRAAELGIDPASAQAIIRAMSLSREPVGAR